MYCKMTQFCLYIYIYSFFRVFSSIDYYEILSRLWRLEIGSWQIKLFKMRSYWRRMDPPLNPVWVVSYEKWDFGRRHVPGHFIMWSWRQRSGAMPQHKPRNTKDLPPDLQKLGKRHGTDLSHHLQEEPALLTPQFLISGLLSWETMRLCCLSHPVCGYYDSSPGQKNQSFTWWEQVEGLGRRHMLN